MNETEVTQLAHELMTLHGLTDYTFQFDHAKRRLGQCRRGDMIISLSIHYVTNNNPELIRDTILHEIAHALTPGHMHDHVWKSIAYKIGVRHFSKAGMITYTTPLVTYECPNCHKEIGFYRHIKMNRERACGTCCEKYNNGRFSKDYVIQLKRT